MDVGSQLLIFGVLQIFGIAWWVIKQTGDDPTESLLFNLPLPKIEKLNALLLSALIFIGLGLVLVAVPKIH